MQYIFFLFIFTILISCQSQEEKLVADFSKKVEAFEKKAASGNNATNAGELDRMSDEIGNIIIELSEKELTASEQEEVSRISLRFQIALITVQDKMDATRKHDMNSMPADHIKKDSL